MSASDVVALWGARHQTDNQSIAGRAVATRGKKIRRGRRREARCQREIERHRNADKSYLGEGIALLDLARNAQRLFAKQEPREKRRLLNFLLSNCTWEDGEVTATFRQPFDMLAQKIYGTRHDNADQIGSALVFEKWLPGPDSNQRPSG